MRRLVIGQLPLEDVGRNLAGLPEVDLLEPQPLDLRNHPPVRSQQVKIGDDRSRAAPDDARAAELQILRLVIKPELLELNRQIGRAVTADVRRHQTDQNLDAGIDHRRMDAIAREVLTNRRRRLELREGLTFADENVREALKGGSVRESKTRRGLIMSRLFHPAAESPLQPIERDRRWRIGFG